MANNRIFQLGRVLPKVLENNHVRFCTSTKADNTKKPSNDDKTCEEKMCANDNKCCPPKPDCVRCPKYYKDNKWDFPREILKESCTVRKKVCKTEPNDCSDELKRKSCEKAAAECAPIPRQQSFFSRLFSREKKPKDLPKRKASIMDNCKKVYPMKDAVKRGPLPGSPKR